MQENYSRAQDPIPTISFSEMLKLVFRGAMQLIRDFLIFFRRYLILLLIFVVFGVVAGVLHFRVSPVYYKLSTVVRHTEMTTATFGRMVDNLGGLAESGSTGALAALLRIPEPTAGKIITMKAYTIERGDLQKDTVSEKERSFIIDVRISENAIADTLQRALVDYFNNNDYIASLKRNEITINEERLKFIDGELRRLDTLKDVYNRFLTQPRSAAVFNNTFDPANLYKQADLYSLERQKIQGWLLEKKQAVLTIDEFKPSRIPSSITMQQSILLYVLIFFLIGCTIGGVIDFFKSGKTQQ